MSEGTGRDARLHFTLKFSYLGCGTEHKVDTTTRKRTSSNWRKHPCTMLDLKYILYHFVMSHTMDYIISTSRIKTHFQISVNVIKGGPLEL